MNEDEPDFGEVEAVQLVRAMNGGGSQSKLVLCSDENMYVVKFIGNPQGTKILANEFACAYIGHLMGAPCPPFAQVDVPQSVGSRTGLPQGIHFGSLYIVDEDGASFNNPSPDIVTKFVNTGDLALAVVFDTLVANENRHWGHVVYNRANGPHARSSPGGDIYRFWIIDHGHTLAVASPWSSLRTPRPPHPNVLQTFGPYVSGRNPFDEAFNRLEAITAPKMTRCVERLPSDVWGVSQGDEQGLIEYLMSQKEAIPNLIRENRGSFPNWTD